MQKIYKEILKKIMINGINSNPRGLNIKEIINFSIKIENILECGVNYPSKKFNFKYLAAELIWYLSRSLTVENIEQYASLWGKIKNKDGLINSNYGYLVFGRLLPIGISQFDFVFETLKKDKDSRQAILRYNNDSVQDLKTLDFICTLFQQFFIRDNKLICIIQLRSNDAFYGFPYDIVWFSLIHQSIFLELKEFYLELELGEVYYNASSMHIYENFFNKANIIIQENGENIKIKLNKSLRYQLTKTFDILWDKLGQTDDYIGFLENNFNLKVDKYEKNL